MENSTDVGSAALIGPNQILPFNLDAARDGAAIAMANGQPAEFIAFCERAVFPLVILAGPNNEIEVYRADGTTPHGDEYALVMVVPVETRYVNLFADGKGAERGSGEHFASADEATMESRHWLEFGGAPMLAIAVPVEVPARST
jgi:hypothetical protein